MYLLISKYGYALPVLYRQFKTGKDVKAFIRNVNYRRNLKGVISKLNTMAEGVALDPELMIFDDIGTGNFADKYRSKGFNVFGGSMLCDKLYYDKDFCDKKLRTLGLVKRDLEGDTSRLTLGVRYSDGKYIDSCAFATTESFYPMEFGDYLEGMCTLGWRNDKYLDEINKLTPYIEKHKFSGILYLQYMTNGKDLSFVTIFPYLNKDYFNCHASLYDNIFDINCKPNSLYAITLRVTVAPYPFDQYKLNEYVYGGIKGLKVDGIGGKFYPDDLMFDKDWQVSGNTGILGDIYASGANPEMMCTEITEAFHKIKCDNKIARIDFPEFIRAKLEFFGLKTKGIQIKPKVDYRALYFSAVRKGTQEVVKVTRLLRSEGIKLSDILGG